MMFIQLALTFILFLTKQVIGNEILGCNGFIKSPIELNFSAIEIKLLTKQGSLKDRTECAPNNGYFFLPVYDKGEYILRVSPPNGWVFEPAEVALNVDGVSDSCSQGKDIYFYFRGFSVIGKIVSIDNTIGPKGVRVQLWEEHKQALDSLKTFSTLSTDDGSFEFSSVMPGTYHVQASHSSWMFLKDQVIDFKVTNDSYIIPINSLIIAGYEVSGSVTSDKEPIKGVRFILFSKGKSVKVKGCDNFTLQNFNQAGLGLDDATLICHVASDDKGSFVFPCVPPGEYIIVPYYRAVEANYIKFDVHPQSLPISVSHNSLKIDTPFKVEGFSVSGRVLYSSEGEPYSGASVYLNGKPVTETKSDGIFDLVGMNAGMYKLQIYCNDLKFEEKTLKVSPNAPNFGDFIPDSYKVTGSLTVSKPINKHLTSERKVIFVESSTGKKIEVITNHNGHYELYLHKGEYTASVFNSEDEEEKGLVFASVEKTIKVETKPLSEINFALLEATVTGIIDCLQPCIDIAVTLKSRGKTTVVSKPAGNTGKLRLQCKYIFDEVASGNYLVSIDPEIEWCWKEQELKLTVSSQNVKGPTFTQTGIAITIKSSHDTKIKYSSGKISDEVDIHKDINRICVKSPVWEESAPVKNEYDIEFLGCHGYETQKIHWTGGLINIKAITHEYVGRVISNEMVDDLMINILDKPNDEKDENLKQHNNVRRLGPLSNPKKNSDGLTEYTFSLQLFPNETVILVPAASSLLFSPVSVEIVGGDDCTTISQGVVLKAEKGKIVSGKITANKIPLPGVQITIHNADRGEDTTTETNSEGIYHFGPLGVHVKFSVTAEKEGYVLVGPNEEGNFFAHKLAEVIVEVKDKADGTPLQSVLLSLSGGENYRSNSQTGPDGKVSFLSLSPSEYYLRPMMKEYRFDPPSKMIAVKEGATVSVLLSGERVAYSVFGSVTSLSGDPEGSITVEAVGQGTSECTQFQEESASESNGQFRIRGLQPKCDYIVRVKEAPGINTNIIRSTPDGISVKVTKEDIQGLRLVVFYAISRTDITVLITADKPQYLQSLRTKLIRDDTTVHSVRLSDYKGTPSYPLSTIALAFPSVPADGKNYYVQFESSLSQNSHSYTLHPVHFKANSSFRLVRFTFSPILKPHDSELSQTSYLVLPLVIIAALVYYQREHVIFILTKVLQAKYTPNSVYLSQRGSLIDDSGSDTAIVEQISGKRKLKPRKT